jgi:two-component system chemotaxis response regulator CheY
MAPLIFVIEDEKDIRESLTEAIENEGYSAISASNGRVAISMFEDENQNPAKLPDLILLDLLMPQMNGATFLAEARKNRRLAKVPIVLMSADRKMAQKASHLGADGHLHKPLELEDLFAAIEKHRIQ